MVVANGNFNPQQQVRLTAADRRTLAWTSTSSRQKIIPGFQTTLSRSNPRVNRCATCKQVFSSTNDMKKHVALTHTGTKPIVCEICGKRFDSTTHMASHYELHKEPRLQEFGILSRRRKAQSLPSSEESSLTTTVGSYHGLPKGLKAYASEPTDNSFGTAQSFFPSENESERRLRKFAERHKQGNRNKQTTTNLPALTQNQSRTSYENYSSLTRSANTNKTSLPSIDPGNISVIGSVMGSRKVIETGKQSNFLRNAEDRLIQARMEAVSLASRSPSPKSLYPTSLAEYLPPKSAFSRSSLADKFRQLPPKEKIWDTGSHVTRQMSGTTTISGYDPVLEKRMSANIRSTRKESLLPSITRHGNSAN